MNPNEAKIEIDRLSVELARHNHLYYVESNPEISDYDFDVLLKKLQELEVTPDEASLERVPLTKKVIDDETMAKIEKLIGLLEEDDDVVTVYHNIQD